MKIKVSLFIVIALLIVFGLQMVSAQSETGYPIEGDAGYPIETPPPLSCKEKDFTITWHPQVEGFCDTCPDYCAKRDKPNLPPPAQPVVENTPATNQNIVNRIMATNQLLRANRIRRPIVIPVRNILDNLWRLGEVK